MGWEANNLPLYDSKVSINQKKLKTAMRLRNFSTRPRDGRECIERIFAEVDRPAIAIYNIEKNHLECAPDAGDPHDVERKFALDSETVNDIRREVHGAEHVILAYDFCNGNVYIVDAVPELAIASAILTVLFAFISGYGCKKQNFETMDKKPCACNESSRKKLGLPIDDTTICVNTSEDDNPLSGLRRLTPNFKLHY